MGKKVALSTESLAGGAGDEGDGEARPLAGMNATSMSKDSPEPGSPASTQCMAAAETPS
jgi:hypothetical protein